MVCKGEYATHVDALSKDREGELADLKQSHVEEIRLKSEEEDKRVMGIREEEKVRLEGLQKKKEEEIQRLVQTENLYLR